MTTCIEYIAVQSGNFVHVNWSFLYSFVLNIVALYVVHLFYTSIVNQRNKAY